MKVLTTFNHLGELGNEFLCGNCVFYQTWTPPGKETEYYCWRYPNPIDTGPEGYCGEYWPTKAYLKELER